MQAFEAMEDIQMNKLRFAVIFASLMMLSVYFAGAASAEGVSVYEMLTKLNRAVFGITGAQVSGSDAIAVGVAEAACSDSDGGKIYETRGNTKLSVPIVGQLSEANDWCNGNSVVEYYCSDNQNSVISPVSYSCPNGCKDGACVAAACPSKIVFTLDKSSYVYGESATIKVSTYDSSGVLAGFDLSVLTELADGTDFSSDTISTKPSGMYSYTGSVGLDAGTYTMVVSSPECSVPSAYQTLVVVGKPVPSCSDSDDGLDYFTYGVAKGVNGYGQVIDSYDFCKGDKVVESYCDNGVVRNISRACPNGCSDGACLPAPVVVTCTDSDGGTVLDVKGTASDAAGTANDECVYLNGYDKPWLKEWWCDSETGKKTYGDGLNNCEAYGYSTCVAGACVAAACPSKIVFTLDKSSYVYGESATIKVSTYDSSGVLAGFDLSVLTELADGTDFSSDTISTKPSGTYSYTGSVGLDAGTYTMVVSSPECSVPSAYQTLVVVEKSVLACSDSDGGLNYDVKGKASSVDGKSSGVDCCTASSGSTCTDKGDFIREYVCSKDAVASENYKCRNGCRDGACVMPVACSDSDGGVNYYAKGTATGVNVFDKSHYESPVSKTHVDKCYDEACTNGKCVNSGRLQEFYCNSESLVDWDDYACSNGCNDGACIIKTSDNYVLSEGKGGSYPVGGKHYDVFADYVGNDGVIFVVTGQKTALIKESGIASIRVSDNLFLDIRVVDILVQVGGVNKVEFTLSITKAICTDSDGGLDYYRQGTVTYGSVSNTDLCAIEACEEGKPCNPKSFVEEYFCGKAGVDSTSFACSYGCSDGACIEDGSGLFIERDIGGFVFKEVYSDEECAIVLNDPVCTLAGARYAYTGAGVREVVALVEVHSAQFTEAEFIDGVKRVAESEPNANLEMGSFSGNNFVLLSKKSASETDADYLVLWYHENKAVAISIMDWNVVSVDDSVFEELLDAYLNKYPSQLSSDALEEPPQLPPDENFAGTLWLGSGWNLVGAFLLTEASVETDCGDSNNILAAYYYDPVARRYVDILAAEAGDDVEKEKEATAANAASVVGSANTKASKSRGVTGGGGGGSASGNYMVVDKVNSFWLKVANSCKIDFELDEPYGWLSEVQDGDKKLARGWNFLSVVPDMVDHTIDGFSGTCSVSRAYSFDPESQSWGNVRDETFSEGIVGSGYAVKVASDCVLGPTEAQVTPVAGPPELPAE